MVPTDSGGPATCDSSRQAKLASFVQILLGQDNLLKRKCPCTQLGTVLQDGGCKQSLLESDSQYSPGDSMAVSTRRGQGEMKGASFGVRKNQTNQNLLPLKLAVCPAAAAVAVNSIYGTPNWVFGTTNPGTVLADACATYSTRPSTKAFNGSVLLKDNIATPRQRCNDYTKIK